MKLSHKLKGKVLVITIHGDVEATQAKRLKSYCLEQMEESKAEVVVLDIEEVPYIDSMGLSSFLSMYKAVRQEDGVFAVAAPQKEVQKLFELCCLDKIFVVYDSVEEACEGLQQ